MRDNAVKSSLAAHGKALGSMVFEFFTPGMPRILADAGAEFALYCMEHTGAGFETLKPQLALCRALGVMVPLVDDAEQARFIVSCTCYPPEGRHGAAFGFAHDDFEGGDVPGVDVLWLGHLLHVRATSSAAAWPPTPPANAIARDQPAASANMRSAPRAQRGKRQNSGAQEPRPCRQGGQNFRNRQLF